MDGGEIVEFALRRESFGEKERVTARYGALKASMFRFDTGVEAVRLDKMKGNVRILPARARARFVTRLGYVDRANAAAAARSIEESGA